MTLRPWFRPGLLGLHLFAVAATTFCIVMGLWQLGVYDTRQADERADQRAVPRVELAGLWGPDQAFEARLNQRPVRVTGQFATAEQFWVTERLQDGVAGAWLVAPLLIGEQNDALLVVRGWAPAPADASPAPAGTVTIDATLQPGQSAGSPWDSDRREIGSLRIPALTNELPYDLYSGFAISTDRDVAAGLLLAKVPSADVSWTVGLRNLAYALQWWVFGAFTLFMWWRMASEQVAAGSLRT